MKMFIEELGGCLYVIVLGKVLLAVMNTFYQLAI